MSLKARISRLFLFLLLFVFLSLSVFLSVLFLLLSLFLAFFVAVVLFWLFFCFDPCHRFCGFVRFVVVVLVVILSIPLVPNISRTAILLFIVRFISMVIHDHSRELQDCCQIIPAVMSCGSSRMVSGFWHDCEFCSDRLPAIAPEDSDLKPHFQQCPSVDGSESSEGCSDVSHPQCWHAGKVHGPKALKSKTHKPCPSRPSACLREETEEN